MLKNHLPFTRHRQTTALLRASHAGFTLVELIVTISIGAILLAIAVPSFEQVMRTNRIAAVTNGLSSALRLARSEAITRGTIVTVCKSDDISDSTPTCNTGAAWQDGWIVFVDNNNNGDLDSGELPLRVGQASSSNAVITTGAHFQDFVKFQSNGWAGGDVINDTFYICIEPDQRSLVFNKMGRLLIETGTCP